MESRDGGGGECGGCGRGRGLGGRGHQQQLPQAAECRRDAEVCGLPPGAPVLPGWTGCWSATSPTPSPASKNLSSSLYTVSPNLALRLTRAPQPLPISPNSELYWLGFTDLFAPVTADSQGVVRLLDHRAGAWLPLLDTRAHSKGRSDTHYIVAVSQVEWEARTILCRGSRYRIMYTVLILQVLIREMYQLLSSRYPPTLPRPLPTSLPLSPPLAGAAHCTLHCTLALECKLWPWSSIVEQDNLQKETCHFDPKEDKF